MKCFSAQKRHQRNPQNRPCWNNLTFHQFPPYIYFSIIWHPRSSKSLFSVLSLFYKFIVLLLRCYITPSSNLPFELLITEYVCVMCICMVQTLLNLCFSLLNLSCQSNLQSSNQWIYDTGTQKNFFSPTAPRPSMAGPKPSRAPKVHFLTNTQIPYISIYPACIRGTTKN